MRLKFGGLVAFLPALFVVAQVFAQGPASKPLQGELRIHDPSTIIHCPSNYWVFGTGWGIRSRFSTDLIDWQAGPAVFTTSPSWTTNAVPGNRGHLWAPDAVQIRDHYYLYYSVSTWGSRNSAIGLATAALPPASQTNLAWEDHGLVVRTTTQDQFNAIDPSALLDSSGRLWLAFGSYWSGIKLIELDPATGLRQDTNSPIHSLAWNESIEAAYLYQHGDYYYLFVNWGQCCRGTNSTYEIRVGRSPVATGPFVDGTGKDMLQRGGNLFLKTAGPRIGPGHAAILKDGQHFWFSYHYYDGDEHGVSKLGILPLTWTADGWPASITARGDSFSPHDSK
jgi:arabinan endo-1,5-alpha-L-arabinosidase